jgi:hypothetical protein
MVNCEELICTTEYLMLYTRCRINRCRYNRVPLYYDPIIIICILCTYNQGFQKKTKVDGNLYSLVSIKEIRS